MGNKPIREKKYTEHTPVRLEKHIKDKLLKISHFNDVSITSLLRRKLPELIKEYECPSCKSLKIDTTSSFKTCKECGNKFS